MRESLPLMNINSLLETLQVFLPVNHFSLSLGYTEIFISYIFFT